MTLGVLELDWLPLGMRQSSYRLFTGVYCSFSWVRFTELGRYSSYGMMLLPMTSQMS